MKVAFLLNDLSLSGGVGVVVRHARNLRDVHGVDASLVLVRDEAAERWTYRALESVPVSMLRDVREDSFDVAVATWWETTAALPTIRATRRAYFVQSLEDRFYEREHVAMALGARATFDLPVAFITEALWIRDTLTQLRPEVPCHYVRNGIDKDVFRSPQAVEPQLDRPLRILIEGRSDSWFKGVPDAVAAVRRMREPCTLTVVDPAGNVRDADRAFESVTAVELAAIYADTDVMVKLSRVEGMYGPPLEGFHLGATCVTTPVTGHSEYVVHGWNALEVAWDDPSGTARTLDLLARDRRLLHFLRMNALATAQSWPDLRQSSELMMLALSRICNTAPPVAAAEVKQIQAVRLHVHELYADAARLPSATGFKVRLLSRLWSSRWGSRALRVYGETPLVRFLRPLIRRVLR